MTVERVAHAALILLRRAPILTSDQTNPMIRYEVRYQVPYNQCEWRSQWFRTYEEAQRMVEFYRSCGSPAHLAP